MSHENSNAASESDINLHRVYTGHERRNKNTIELIISDALYTGCGAALRDKSPTVLPRSIYDILTQSSNDLQYFVTSSVDTM